MSRNVRAGPGPVPNRWLNCPRKSESVIAERFMAFKTPLSNVFNDQVPMECLFLPEMIFSYCKTLKLSLGLWIDLTNTKRFYDSEVVKSRGIQYVKLQCRGHGETPSPEQTQSFIEIVDNFINERPFDIVAVHCTHGFNRTGFLIASYLVERLDYSVEAALSIFANARPPGIYKQDYINELFRRYEDEEDAPQAPELPDWCLEYDDSPGGFVNNGPTKRKFQEIPPSSTSQQAATIALQQGTGTHSNGERGGTNTPNEDDLIEKNGEESEDGGEASVSNGGRPRKKRRKEMVIKNATFMEGVPGVTLVTEQPLLGQLQLKVQQMCNWNDSGFPGAQPVSMDHSNIQLLHVKPYRVSWKADGMRYMMLINKRDEIYFFDRNHSCFQVEDLTFLKAGNLNEHLEDTLLDGEMVLDKLNGETIPRYLIYDIVKFCGTDIYKQPFYPNRLRCIKKEIIDPRFEAITQGLINRPMEPFGVRNKEFWEIRKSASLLGEKFAKSLLHEPDGLIFQPSLQPYTAGVCPDVLKWKPSNMNSIDFRLKIVTEDGVGLVPTKIGLLYVGGRDAPYDRMKYTKALKDLDNKIIECAVNTRGQWEFMRERTDKTYPNSFGTAQAVVKSIRHPITKEGLLQFIDNFGFRDDHDMMPPPPPQQQQHQHQHQQHQQRHHPNHPQQQHQQQQHRHHQNPPHHAQQPPPAQHQEVPHQQQLQHQQMPRQQ